MESVSSLFTAADTDSATMVGNRPDLDKGMPKTTLIVAPSGAIKQWMEEIETHVKPGVFPKVLHYKHSNGLSMANLLDQDIIGQYSYPPGQATLTSAQSPAITR